jgi:hypothetical protein
MSHFRLSVDRLPEADAQPSSVTEASHEVAAERHRRNHEQGDRAAIGCADCLSFSLNFVYRSPSSKEDR